MQRFAPTMHGARQDFYCVSIVYRAYISNCRQASSVDIERVCRIAVDYSLPLVIREEGFEVVVDIHDTVISALDAPHSVILVLGVAVVDVCIGIYRQCAGVWSGIRQPYLWRKGFEVIPINFPDRGRQ